LNGFFYKIIKDLFLKFLASIKQAV